MILIDTHVWIWMNLAPGNLSPTARDQLRKAPRLAVSSISIYETMAAVQKGRISSPMDPETLIRKWLKSTDVIRISVSEEAAIKSRSLSFQHEDPFDRIIAGTAVVEGIPLMTADGNLLKLSWLDTIPAC